ncbi:hypothetical protein PAHAL_3G324900 [Panicum hallii]|uniref:Uncharacterized protein n=1 Tax=Panicum hallii TaxID=206008 RepID=A0A2T8KK87_9POAL|nr:hypothetical protein PAHAL_3G324900 [Panicum hallii]
MLIVSPIHQKTASLPTSSPRLPTSSPVRKQFQLALVAAAALPNAPPGSSSSRLAAVHALAAGIALSPTPPLPRPPRALGLSSPSPASTTTLSPPPQAVSSPPTKPCSPPMTPRQHRGRGGRRRRRPLAPHPHEVAGLPPRSTSTCQP